MVTNCVVPACTARKRKRGSGVKYYRFPLKDEERCKRWLRAINNPKYDENTPLDRLKNLRVCSLHFTSDDYERNMMTELMGEGEKKLKPSAVPSHLDTNDEEQTPSTELYATYQLHDTSAVMDGSPDQITSTGIQGNVPETCTETAKKPTVQHVVDEEAILQLMKDCPMCDRQCRCSKHTRGPYLIVYQSCYFCNYQRKWANQPEARDMNIHHKTNAQPKKKPKPKDKVSVNAKAQPSQINKTTVSESSVSESQDPLET